MVKTKIVSCVLVAFLCFSIGCYNAEMVSKDELKAQTEQVDITVVTKDSLQYKFIKNNYQIRGDTLSGFGVRTRSNSSEIVFDARLALSDMTIIETKEFSARQTIAFIAALGIVGYLIIKVLFPH